MKASGKRGTDLVVCIKCGCKCTDLNTGMMVISCVDWNIMQCNRIFLNLVKKVIIVCQQLPLSATEHFQQLSQRPKLSFSSCQGKIPLLCPLTFFLELYCNRIIYASLSYSISCTHSIYHSYFVQIILALVPIPYNFGSVFIKLLSTCFVNRVLFSNYGVNWMNLYVYIMCKPAHCIF